MQKFKASFELIIEVDKDLTTVNDKIKDKIEDFLDNLELYEVVGVGDLNLEDIGPVSQKELEEWGLE